jgi:hypothetical protein
MKKIATIVFFLIASNGFASVLRVNNTLGASTPNIYTTIQAAHNAASTGDTLLVEPSVMGYGNLVATKKLVVFGNGYYLGPASSNFNPGLQLSNNTSTLGSVKFDVGSEGSTMMGISMGVDLCTIATNNITFSRNNVQFVNLTLTASNCIISQNILFQLNFAGTNNNNMVRNNFIANKLTIDANDLNNVVENNIFQGANTYNVQNAIVRNNIDLGVNSLVLTNSTVDNNASTNGLFGAANGNITAAGSAMVEDIANSSALFSEDSRWKLKATSPAKATGFNGDDMGIFGGLTPYILSGIPPIPTIYKFIAPTSVAGSSMSIIISTRNNQ